MPEPISKQPSFHVAPARTVSVIIPTYNRAGLLTATLASVHAQTVPPSEVFVVDDGSTDDTVGAIAQFRAENPEAGERLHFLQQANQGKSVALNHALERVTGEWIAFNDSDDLWRPEKLELQFRALDRFPDCGACFTDACYRNNETRLGTSFQAGGRNFPDETGRMDDAREVMAGLSHGIMMQSVVVRADIMRQVGEFDPLLRVAQDADFLFRLSLITRLCYVNRPLVEMDRTPQRTHGLTSDFPIESPVRLSLREKMLTKWLSLVDGEAAGIRRIIAAQLRSTRSALFNQHVVLDQVAEARAVIARGLRDQFDCRLALKWVLASCLPPAMVRTLVRR